MRQRPEATIPKFELDKLSERISKTECAPPALEPAGRLLASNISALLTPIFAEKAKEALDGASVEVRHTHAYCFEKDLKEVADKRMNNKIFILWIVIIVMFEMIAISTITYYFGEAHWAKEFQKVCTSEYLTSEEKEQITHNSLSIAILPSNYRKDPERAQIKLKEYKRILKNRKKESAKKGTFSADEPIQWP